MARVRTTWSKTAGNPPATPGYGTEDQDHPASYEDPDYEAYKSGDPDAWAETPYPPPYLEGNPPSTPGYDVEDQDHPGYVKRERYPKNAKLVVQAAERKAAKCITIAQHLLGKTASVKTIEKQALALMDLPDTRIDAKLKRLGGGFLATGDEAVSMFDEEMPMDDTYMAEDDALMADHMEDGVMAGMKAELDELRAEVMSMKHADQNVYPGPTLGDPALTEEQARKEPYTVMASKYRKTAKFKRLATRMFSAMDTDGDGLISMDEADDISASAFTAMDDDGDGIVSMDDFMANVDEGALMAEMMKEDTAMGCGDAFMAEDPMDEEMAMMKAARRRRLAKKMAEDDEDGDAEMEKAAARYRLAKKMAEDEDEDEDEEESESVAKEAHRLMRRLAAEEQEAEEEEKAKEASYRRRLAKKMAEDEDEEGEEKTASLLRRARLRRLAEEQEAEEEEMKKEARRLRAKKMAEDDEEDTKETEKEASRRYARYMRKLAEEDDESEDSEEESDPEEDTKAAKKAALLRRARLQRLAEEKESEEDEKAAEEEEEKAAKKVALRRKAKHAEEEEDAAEKQARALAKLAQDEEEDAEEDIVEAAKKASKENAMSEKEALSFFAPEDGADVGFDDADPSSVLTDGEQELLGEIFAAGTPKTASADPLAKQLRPRPKKASFGPRTLGALPKTASTGISNLSDLWSAPPDVREHFNLTDPSFNR